MTGGPFLVAAVQAKPVFLDGDATVDKACGLIAEAAAAGARLVAFPELFVPAYPAWIWHIPPRETAVLRGLYADLLRGAVSIPGDATDRLGEAARKAGVTVTIGVNERNDEASGTSLYNTLLFFGDDGEILGRHRKLVPTTAERLVHAQGDGSTIRVHDLPIGRLGGMICWEWYMPLLRYTLAAMGAQILVGPTWDRGEPWTSTLRHSAKETRCYVLGCGSILERSDIPERYSFVERFVPGDVEWLNTGGSCIVDPDGKLIAGPVEKREEILFAEIDPEAATGSSFQLDVAGHYARPDVFDLRVDLEPRPLIRSWDLDEEDDPEDLDEEDLEEDDRDAAGLGPDPFDVSGLRIEGEIEDDD